MRVRFVGGEELKAVMKYARYISEAGKRIGNRSQFSRKDGKDEREKQ